MWILAFIFIALLLGCILDEVVAIRKLLEKNKDNGANDE
jgi:hypothetical protein